LLFGLIEDKKKFFLYFLTFKTNVRKSGYE
jgi:hypothetical protein